MSETGKGALGPSTTHVGKALAISLRGRELIITRFSPSGSYFTEQLTLPEDNRALQALRDDLSQLLVSK